MSEHAFERFRKAHSLSQKELGELLNLSQARVSHYVTGRNTLPPEVAHDFLRVAREHGDEYSLEDVYPAPQLATAKTA